MALQNSGSSRKFRISQYGKLLACSLFGAMLAAGTAQAQVVYSIGVQEVYDDNIYLEGDVAPPLPAAGTETGMPFVITDDFDGEANEDFITNVTLGASSALEFSPHVKSSIGAQLGFLMFADYSDESRMTLDAFFGASSESSLIPDPFRLSFSDRISSTNGRSSVAAGTATRQAQENDASLTLTVAEQEIAELTTVGGNYSFTRHDFLGEFLFSGSDSNVRLEEEGADYFQNSVTVAFRRQFNERLSASFDNLLSYQTFTGGDSVDFGASDVEENDRMNYRPSVGVGYIVTDQLLASGSVGMDLTRFNDEPTPRAVSIVNADGTTSSFTQESKSTETSLFFSGALDYNPIADASLRIGADQSAGTDVDGDRILVRAVYANVNYLVFEKLTVGSGGRYSQYTNDNSLTGSNDQIEASVYVRYALAPTWSLGAGYNYTRQNVGDADQSVYFREQDYESNRIYISLDTGFVGMLQ